MSNNAFVVRWKSKVNGRAGKGTKRFDRKQGELLVQELNREYPDIEHELIEAPESEEFSSSETTEERPGPSKHAHAGSFR
jgi:hypothetical protein